MKYSFKLLVISLLLLSCKKENSIPTVNYSLVLSDNIVLEKTEVINKSGNNLSFKLKTIYLNKNYVFGSYRQGNNFIDTISFFQGVDWTFSFDSTNISNPDNETGNSSIAIIHDKNMTSGWGKEEYSDGFNYFLKNSLENGNEFLFVGAGRESANNPCKFYNESFITNYNEDAKNTLYEFCSNQLNGTPSIYDAIDKTIEKLNEKANNEEKHIIVFFDKEDDGKGITKEQLIEKAIENNIKLSFFRWDHSSNYMGDYLNISYKTNGYFAIHQSTAKMYNNLFSMNKIISKNYINLNIYITLNTFLIPSANYWADIITIDNNNYIPFYIEF